LKKLNYQLQVRKIVNSNEFRGDRNFFTNNIRCLRPHHKKQQRQKASFLKRFENPQWGKAFWNAFPRRIAKVFGYRARTFQLSFESR
jgi:hypothetical protein